MTNEEAIEYAKNIGFCTGCLDYQHNECDDCEHREFFEKTIEALEKAEKYKAIITDTIDGIDWYHNNCGDMVQGSNSDYETFVKFKDLVDAFYNIGLYGDDEE